MKNRRDVCYAKDAGYVEFDELSGSIKTGCQATPAYKSRYCEQHIIMAKVCSYLVLLLKESNKWSIDGMNNSQYSYGLVLQWQILYCWTDGL